MNTLVLAIFAFILTGYTGWVTAMVCRSADLERHQKILQTALAWLLPLFGAVFVHLINRVQAQVLPPTEN
jgi:hypothetical protein